jgi:hypothetical protein
MSVCMKVCEVIEQCVCKMLDEMNNGEGATRKTFQISEYSSVRYCSNWRSRRGIVVDLTHRGNSVAIPNCVVQSSGYYY